MRKKPSDKTIKYKIKKVHKFFNTRRKNQKLFTVSKANLRFTSYGVKLTRNCILTDKQLDIALYRLNIRIKKQYRF